MCILPQSLSERLDPLLQFRHAPLIVGSSAQIIRRFSYQVLYSKHYATHQILVSRAINTHALMKLICGTELPEFDTLCTGNEAQSGDTPEHQITSFHFKIKKSADSHIKSYLFFKKNLDLIAYSLYFIFFS